MDYQHADVSDVIDAPIEHMAELVTTTLSRLGWRIKFVNAKLGQASASENKTQHSSVTWHFEYDAVLKWQQHQKAIEVVVNVSEKQMQWTEEECLKRCNEILDGIEYDAQQLKHTEATAEPVETHGAARWATEAAIEKHGYLDGSNDHRRFILGPWSSNKHITIPALETEMHAVVCGPTGCGKSSTVYIPNLIERTGVSAIVTEATAGDEPPDLFYKTAGFRQKAGHQIYKFNPDDLTSHRINPIQYIKKYDQASNVARLIIENTSSQFTKDAKIWEDSEQHLLTVLILHAVGEGGNLGMIRRWLRQGPESLGVILMNSVFPEARDEFLGFYKNSTEGFRNGVVSGLMQRLNLWVNPRIVALTEETDIDVEALPEQLFTFYLAVPAQKTHLKPLAALIFNFILDLALQKKFKHPLALFLDEFTNYGYVPGIAEVMSIIRHRHIPATLGFQDYIQLEKVYGRQDAGLIFSQAGTKFLFRPRDINTAKKISDGLGMKTVVDRKVTSSGHISERDFGRPLMHAGEVMALKGGHAIVLTPSIDPILLKTFTWQDYADATAYEPPEFRKLDISEELVRACNVAKSSPEWQNSKDNKAAGKPKGEPKYDRDRSQQISQTGKQRQQLEEDKHEQERQDKEREKELSKETQRADEMAPPDY